MSHPLKLDFKSNLSHLTERKAQLRTVLWMRLFAVTTLLGVLGLAHWMALVRLPWPTLLFVLGLMLVLNILAALRLRGDSVGPYEVGAQIFSDLFGFSVLLYFTGGATNPFVMFYLPLLGLAAALLPWGQVLALAGFSILAYSVLMLEYIPLVLSKPQNAIELHLLGMWINFLVSVAILVGFVARLSNGIRQRDQDLNTAQDRLNRDARMAALGNQSASLAHELGTPLGTAKIIVSDWMDNLGGLDPQSWQRDTQVLQEQLDRMERTLIHLRSSLESEDQKVNETIFKTLHVKAWLDDWVAGWRNRNPQATLVANLGIATSLKASASWESVELVLNGLFENALQAYSGASEQRILLSALCIENTLHLAIEDNAGGFDKDVLSRIGKEPIRKEHAENRRGMGLYLAVGMIERAGGSMKFSQIVDDGQVLANRVVGARVVLTLPLREVTL